MRSLRSALLVFLACLVTLGVIFWAGYRIGTQAEKQVWLTKQAKLNQEHRTTETVLRADKQALEEAYEVLKDSSERDRAGARAELDRLRHVLAQRKARPSPGPSGTATCPGPTVDEAPAERELFAQCAAALVDLAEEADRVRIQLIGLQGYVEKVVR